MSQANIESIYNLTPLQLGMLFHSVSSPGKGHYNVQTAYEVVGDLDCDAFSCAVQEVISRQTPLRTCFVWNRVKTPTQVVVRQAQLSLDLEDWRAIDPSVREQRFREFLDRDQLVDFDFSKAPILRLKLFRFAEQTYRIVWTAHHSILDGWSVSLVVDECFSIYAAKCAGRPLPPNRSRPFVEFVKWLEAQSSEGAEAHWRRVLDGVVAPTPIAVEQSFEQSKFRGHCEESGQFAVQFPATLTERLVGLSRACHVTLNTLFQAAWGLVLSRHSGCHDVVFGSVSSGRPPALEGAELMVGEFMNTLPVRLRIDPAKSVRGWLQEIQAEQAQSRRYEHTPLVEIQKWSAIPSGKPLFDTVMAFENFRPPVADSPAGLGSLTIRQLAYRHETNFAIGLMIWPDGMRFFWSRRALDELQATRLRDQLVAVLEQMAANGDAPLGTLSGQSPAAISQLVLEWNDTTQDNPAARDVPEMIEQQVRERPDATALVDRDLHVTFAEMDRRASSLAAVLLRLGVGPNTLVGVCLDRNADMVIAKLAVMKAGAAYVPFDVDHPRERLSSVVQEAGVSVILVDERGAENLGRVGARLISVSEHAYETAAVPSTRELPPDRLVYAIFTSGSTGKPKGVLIGLPSLMNLIGGHHSSYRPAPGEHFTQAASIAFDSSACEIWPPLVAGTVLQIVDDVTRHSAPDIKSWCIERGITVVWVPTGLAGEMIQSDWPKPPALRLLATAGDRLLHRPRKDLGFAVMNAYGPTECTVWSTYSMTSDETCAEGRPSIGRAIGNVHVCSLDENYSPTPIEATGELCIGGGGVGCGYVGLPGLTAGRFVPDGLRQRPGSRIYRSGDAVRLLGDGQIDFVGRFDRQVKVRGFRIELGEIETALASHPCVHESVVLSRVVDAGHSRLVAYVVSRDPVKHGVSGTLSRDLVGGWQAMYDAMLGESKPQAPKDPSFNVVGWNSSYTGTPIPPEEMKAWVDGTVERILACSPRRVLEIGCGTGLLLFRVAPHCESYWGVDFSQSSLDWIEHHRGPQLKGVKLLNRTADDFSGIPEHTFDTVVINSVIQYFPSVDYLLRVLDGVFAALKPGGRVFLGDIRNLATAKAFQFSVQLTRNQGLTAGECVSRARAAVQSENELLLDPGFFLALRQRYPELTCVHLMPKPGGYDNELSRFRYDVTLSTAKEAAAGSVTWESWTGGGWSLERLQETLGDDAPECLALTDIPNGRVLGWSRAADWLERAEGDKPAASWQDHADRGTALDPAVLASAGGPSYVCRLSLSPGACDGRLEGVWVRKGVRGQAAKLAVQSTPKSAGEADWTVYANNPLEGHFLRSAASILRRHLRAKLPDYMVPNDFVLLESLPRNASGKVNTALLPDPSGERPRLEKMFRAPSTPTEEAVARVWAAVLGLESVGAEDSYFELGGDSFDSMPIVARLQKEFDLDIPLQVLFENPTVCDLAAAIDKLIAAEKAMIEEVENLSDEEAEALLAAEEGRTGPKDPRGN